MDVVQEPLWTVARSGWAGRLAAMVVSFGGTHWWRLSYVHSWFSSRRKPWNHRLVPSWIR